MDFDALLAHRFRRNLDLETLDIRRINVGRLEKQTDQAGMKLELPHRDDRVFRTCSDNIIRSEDAQTLAGDSQSFDERHLQVIQLYAAVEAGAEGFDNPPFENRFRSLQHDFTHDQQNNECDQR